jgi:diguanylate cyclase (GGDEF)-like protein/PAS domain S-box-containing protein
VDRLRAVLRSPLFLAYAIGPLCLIPLWVLRDLGLIANQPLWVYALVLVVPSLTVSAATNLLYAHRPSRPALHARAATDALATTVVIYATGWGPELGLVYLVSAHHLVGSTSPASWKVARIWVTAGVVCGQIGIALGRVPSFMHNPAAQGAAALGLLAFYLVSRMALTVAVDRDRAWEEAQTSTERFRSLVQNSSDMIMILDESSRAIYVSAACERVLGFTAEELRATDLGTLMHPDEFDSVRDCLREAIQEPGPTAPIELRVRHADGQWRHLELVGTNLRDNPAVAGVVLNVRDVTDRRRAEAELAHQATHDSLTGLPNRVLLLERLGDSLGRRRWSPRRPAVLFLDVDRFKLINDSLGHEVGDQVLVEASRRLLSVAGPDDMVARFGGDEFVVLCDRGGEAETMARRILGSFEEPFRISGQTYFLSTSIGLAAATSVDGRPADLIRDADTAMYRAKEKGRGRLAVFDEAARADAVNRVRTEHLLRGAAERGELRLYYQPEMDLRTGQVVAAEALLRWQHPVQGLVGPSEFIDTAEESGLIIPIGNWVLRTACDQALAWARRGESIGLAVNVSARQLADDGFVETVREAIAPLRSLGRRLSRPQITLEVTERVIIGEPESAAARINELKALGVELSMDDFGTGYSSLSNLRRYPFDSLKIDRRFVSGVTDRDDDATIVRAIIALARGLGKTVVAEGVETAEQLAVLRDLGCDLAQGFHIGRPQPATVSPSDLLLPEQRARTVLSSAG